MSVSGRCRDITRADLLEVAERYLVPNAKAILDQVAEACAQWKRCAREAELPVDEVTRVGTDI